MINVTFLTSKRMKNNITALLLGAATFFTVACGNPDTASQQAGASGKPERGEWVVVHELSDPEGINPMVVNDASARAIFDRVYEHLLIQDFATTDLIPQLAEARPTISDDHLTYTFVLKPNITFSDGKPLTAKDVIFSFKAVKNPLITDAAPLRNYYEDIKDVTSTDDKTIVITMSKPYFLAEYFLGNLSILAKHIQDPKGLTDKYTFAETTTLESAEKNPAMVEFATWFNSSEMKKDPKLNIGSGPYKFDEWRTGESISLVRNTTWWAEGKDADNPSYVDKIVYKVMNDRSQAVVALKNQEVDFMEFVPTAKYVDELDTTNLDYIRKQPFSGFIYTYIGWNTQRAVLSDKLVRKALSHCVDRDALIKQVLRGLAKPVNSPVYEQREEYDTSIQPIPYNTTKAREILAQAGWKDSNGDGILDKNLNGKQTDLSFKFLLNAGNEAREQIALILVDEFKKVGIKADVQKIEWSVFLENLRTRNYDAYIGSWVNDPIPTDNFQLWHSSQANNKGSNYVGFRNKRADELMEMNRQEFDAQKRIAYMKEFQQIVVDEQPYTFLWSPQYPAAWNKRLNNVNFSLVRPGYLPTQWWVAKNNWKYAPAP